MQIKVLGSGCSKCNALEKTVRNAVADLNITADIKKVEDISEIIKYGVLQTPGLVIDERVVSSGKNLNSEDVKSFLKQYCK